MKYSIVTFGCRVNQADSLALEEQLLAAGASAAACDQADLVVVNTCSVTASSEQGARQTIRRVARTNPGARIVVTGCYATRRPDELRELPNVRDVASNDDKPHILAFIGNPDLSAGGLSSTVLTTAERFGEGDGACGASIEPGVAGRTAFTLRVQTGCDEPCTYCIIPVTRGRPRSVPVDSLLRELRRIEAAGFKEIVLTGVHLGSYGRDLVPSSSLTALLGAIARESSGSRRASPDPQPLFRISSLEPMDCSRDVVDLMAEHACFAPHFHLPLQHASNRMLAAMRRPYTIERYSSLVDHIRTRMPYASIGSDVIVGFPGETDDDYAGLVSYLEPSPLTHLHVFPYSDRPGTPASRLDGKVPGAVVRARARRVREVSENLAARFRESQLGTEHRALTLEDGSLALTGNYLKVRIPPGRSRNEWVRIRIAGAATPGGLLTGMLCAGSDRAAAGSPQR